MKKEIIISGFGGQGGLAIGKNLAEAGMDEGLNVTWAPSYGPEMRGGTANCSVVLSDKPVGSPVFAHPTELIALIGEHGLIGMGALDAGSHGGGTAVSGLLHIAGKIIVRKHGAAHRADADGVIQQTQLHQGLGYQLMDDTVIAAGAVVQFRVGQTSGLLIYDRHIT